MQKQIHYLRYVITEQDAHRELLSILRGELRLTTKKIRSVKHDERGILLDGERVTVRKRVMPGQVLEIMLNDSEEKEYRLRPCEMELSILYEDEDLLFLNKPSGIVSHPSLGHADDSLANGVKAYFLSKEERSEVHLVGRLDKDTSGILGIAKNSVTKERMIEARSCGQIRKEYLAIVDGILSEKEGCITIRMEEYRDEQDFYKLKMRRPSKPDGGVEAITHYRVEKEYDHYSLISLFLETGRMHQIRFHMAEIGHPLLGDAIYGHGKDETTGLARAGLHARRVECIHPFTKRRMDILAPIPDDFFLYLDPEYEE